MRYDTQALSKLADRLLSGKSEYDKLKEIGNRQNYPYKIQKLKERLTEDLRFWVAKGPSNRLTDIENDIKLISNMVGKQELTKQEKQRVDELVKKYPIA